ncbi:hypothetical protein [Fulvivirga lutimaris]|uniref:hypothetical protein n=1 Tax=Fulvivirga lutimaris TaxID=1819566 RepID=UPI0012BC854B|nr:hypothetical protein [Fulvivirga lutimaris]MTI39726.1 hypothetical protein [Fulvivirga lutimaris]
MKEEDTKMDQSETLPWQEKLLPFLKWTIILGSISVLGLIIFSITVVYNTSNFKDESIIDSVLVKEVNADYQLLKSMAKLDEYSLRRRHHVGRLAILNNAVYRYIGIIIAFMISLFGSVFILGKINLEKETKINSPKLTIASTSPGLIMIICSVILIGYLSNISDSTDIQDQRSYLPEWKSIENKSETENETNKGENTYSAYPSGSNK